MDRGADRAHPEAIRRHRASPRRRGGARLRRDEGRTAIRRINQMHRSYDISDDDMRYVLSTFVVVPRRWIDTYGWRRLSRHEVVATTEYYRTLGRHMGIPGIPETYEEFEAFLDSYEEAHFAWDAQGRRVSDATLDLMASWYPRPLAPLLRTATPRSPRRAAAARLPLQAAEPVHVLARASRGAHTGPAGPAAAAAPHTALRTAEPGDQGLSERLPAGRPGHPSGPGQGWLPGAAPGRLSGRRCPVRRGSRAASRVRRGSWHARS